MCSGGDSTLKRGEKSQASFTSQLQAAFSAQFGRNQAVFDFLNGKLTAAVNNPQGYSPEALTAAKTNAIQQTAMDYSNADRAVQNQIAARGGSTLPSGVNAQIQGQLAQGAANEETGQLNNITLANEDLKQQNYWRAINGLGLTAGLTNPLGYGSEANQGTNALTGIGQAFNQTTQQGFGATLLNSFGSQLGKTLSGGNLQMTKEL